MPSDSLVRIVYVSRAVAPSGMDPADWPAQIEGILAASRRNNVRVGVTGALIFNRGTFGQVLEGPEAAVEETFMRIEDDPRHDEVQVLELGGITAPAFADWSMGFVGRDRPAVVADVEALRTTQDLSAMGGDAVLALLHRIALERDRALRPA